VSRTIVTLFDEEKMNFGCERRLESERCVERDDGRARFSARILARSRKTVNVKDLRESALAEDDHPSLQIPLQNLMLRPRMGFKRPYGLPWRCHHLFPDRSQRLSFCV
jgi:hypothetical protein